MLEGPRAQTTIDFAIGAGVFLLAVGFVLGFIPGILDPFVQSQNHATVADRAGDRVSTELLSTSVDPYVLNATCTEAFFVGSTPSGCQFDTTDLNDALGVGTRLNVNLTIENSTGIVTVGGVRLAAGEAPPDRSSGVTIAQRAALLDGETRRIFVRVW